jgi:nicotinamidase/pyrazinamidase
MIEYDEGTALLIVDVQNDFADPAGSLAVPGGREVLLVANQQARAASEAGALIAYTQDWHPPQTPHFAAQGGIWPVHCVRDTWGAQFLPGLEVHGPVIRKGTDGKDGYSAFSVRDPRSGERAETGLAELLREHRVEHVVITGLATDYCVKETALDARRQGLAVTVLADGVRAVDREPGDGDRALADMRAAGARVISPPSGTA